MSIITLENMEFYAFHGCMEHEKKIGNVFYVSVSLEMDTAQAGCSDKLEDTLNYQQVYDVVRKEMEIPSCLIENAAQRMMEQLKKNFPGVKSFSLKLSKKNPPLGGKVDRVTIEIKS